MAVKSSEVKFTVVYTVVYPFAGGAPVYLDMAHSTARTGREARSDVVARLYSVGGKLLDCIVFPGRHAGVRSI